jgi:hypothetical protein
MLAGIIPAPELRSPLRDLSRLGAAIYVLILLWYRFVAAIVFIVLK